MTRPQKGRRRPQNRARTFRHMVWIVNQRFRGRAREAKLVWALYRLGRHQVIYAGDEKLGRLGGQCAKSVQRAKAAIEAEGDLIEVVRTKGGRLVNEHGETVAQATGWRILPEAGATIDDAPADIEDKLAEFDRRIAVGMASVRPPDG